MEIAFTYAKALRKWGVKETLKKMYMLGEIKFGEHIGTDWLGNRYYENAELPHGQHRWIEYADIHNFDSASVPADWHGWLHHMSDTPPTTAEDLAAMPGMGGLKVTERDDACFTNHLAPNRVDQERNLTGYRPRGYGVGNLYQQWGEPERYYKQPGHPHHHLAKQGKGGRFINQKNAEFYDPEDPEGLKASKPIRDVELK